ncbi:TonB-dependent receptor [Flavihumibacter sp. R14]|nr:TonB-dependent receptor [Flavihumibacter soli]
MIRIIYLLLFFILYISTSFGQQAVSISGYISDFHSGERLAGASVYSLNNKSGSSSNAYGYFRLAAVKAGTQQVVISMLGYRPDTLSLTIHKDTFIEVKLISKTASLAEVAITDFSKRNLHVSQMNKVGLSPAEIKSLPRFAGEVDVVKALQLLPGVKAGREGSSDFQVRGGGPDQNLILLDGVPIYNSSHTLGLFSVFNADAIKTVELSKGGFPSRYGGRLSSVLDIQLKDGNNDHFRFDVSAGLISSKLLLEGPLKNKNTTFMIGARRTYLDLINSIRQAGSGSSNNYNFYDLNAKISHRFSEKDRLYFSIYSGNDRLALKYANNNDLDKRNNSIAWGSVTSALRYNHLFNDALFGNLTLTYTNYQFKIDNQTLDKDDKTDYTLSYSSKIKDAGVKMDFDYIPSNNHFIRFGSNAVMHDFQPNVTSIKSMDDGDTLADTAYNRNVVKAFEYYLYAEDEIRISRKLQANVGLHFSGFHVQQKNYTSLQPRFSLNWMLTNNNAIRASYARMSQYIHLLSATDSGSPADIWVPSTNSIEPQNSWQSTIGFARVLENSRFEFNVDAFYKEMNHVIEYKQGATFLATDSEQGLIDEASQSFETKVIAGKGTAYGAEFLLRKKEGKSFGWVAYTLAWSNRNFEGINNNEVYPYSYDSRHNLSVVMNHHLSKRIRVSGTWVYSSGLPATVQLSSYGYYDENGIKESLENVNVRNNVRMKSYHRLDLGISFVKQKKRGERSWNISVYNAYNRKNPYFIESGQQGAGANGKTKMYQYSLLPVIPSFSYSYSFR